MTSRDLKITEKNKELEASALRAHSTQSPRLFRACFAVSIKNIHCGHVDNSLLIIQARMVGANQRYIPWKPTAFDTSYPKVSDNQASSYRPKEVVIRFGFCTSNGNRK